MKKKPRITSFSVGRVFNLGNYENMRLDLSVEVPEGNSVKGALFEIMGILKAAHPKPPVQQYEVDSARRQLEDPEAWHKNIKSAKDRRAAIRQMIKDAKAIIKKYENWRKARARAVEKLDHLGASITTKDHKEDWQDGEDYV